MKTIFALILTLLSVFQAEAGHAGKGGPVFMKVLSSSFSSHNIHDGGSVSIDAEVELSAHSRWDRCRGQLASPSLAAWVPITDCKIEHVKGLRFRLHLNQSFPTPTINMDFRVLLQVEGLGSRESSAWIENQTVSVSSSTPIQKIMKPIFTCRNPSKSPDKKQAYFLVGLDTNYDLLSGEIQIYIGKKGTRYPQFLVLSWDGSIWILLPPFEQGAKIQSRNLRKGLSEIVIEFPEPPETFKLWQLYLRNSVWQDQSLGSQPDPCEDIP